MLIARLAWLHALVVMKQTCRCPKEGAQVVYLAAAYHPRIQVACLVGLLVSLAEYLHQLQGGQSWSDTDWILTGSFAYVATATTMCL